MKIVEINGIRIDDETNVIRTIDENKAQNRARKA